MLSIIALLLSGIAFFAGLILVIVQEKADRETFRWTKLRVWTAAVAVISLGAWTLTVATFPWDAVTA